MEKKCINCGKELTLPVIAGYCSKECAEKDFQKDNLETIFSEDEDKEIYKIKKTLLFIVLLALSVLCIILLIIL